MKRGYLLVLFFLLSAGIAAADNEVMSTAVSASNEYDNITFNCSGDTIFSDQDIDKIELYHDATGSMELNKTNTTFTAGKNVSATFFVENVQAGTHNWKCKAYLVNTTSVESSSSTFSASDPPSSNEAPQFSGSLPNVTLAEDSTNSSTFDLDNFFTDPDADTMTYTFSGSSAIGTYVNVSVESGNVVKMIGMKNWSSTATIAFTASDGSLTNTSNTVTINVTPVNDAPYLSSPIPSQNWSRNTDKTIDLGNYFADVDSSSHNYSVQTSPSHVTVNISGDTATLVPETDWAGSTSIVFRASDGSLTADSNSVELNVNGNGSTTSSSAPSIDSHTPILPGVSMAVGEEMEFSITKSDPNGDSMTVEWFLDGGVIDGAENDEYTFVASEEGKFKLKVSISDGDLATTYTWSISVIAAGESGLSSSVGTGDTNVSSIVTGSGIGAGVCGDGKIDEGEDCLNCEADAGCAQNELCDEGVCKAKPTWWKPVLLVLLILGVLGSGGYLGYYFISQKRAHKSLNILRKDADRKLGSGIEVAPASEFSDFLKKKEQQLKGEYKKKEEKDDTPDPLSALKGYIGKMKDKGHTDSEIIEKLKGKGWKEKQIKDAMK